jgi:hypothetical protein
MRKVLKKGGAEAEVEELLGGFGSTAVCFFIETLF